MIRWSSFRSSGTVKVEQMGRDDLIAVPKRKDCKRVRHTSFLAFLLNASHPPPSLQDLHPGEDTPMTTPRPPSRGAPSTSTTRPLRNALLTPSASHSSLSTRTPLASRPLSGATPSASAANVITNGAATAGGSISRNPSLTGTNGNLTTPTPLPGYMRPTSRSLKRDTLAAELERGRC
jgi:hypothetical protein